MNDAKAECIIAPPSRFLAIDWAEIWRYRELFFTLAWRDVAVRYKQTLFGVLWAVLQPIVSMVVFSLIFNRMAGIQSGDGSPYPVFLFTGQIFWLYFSSALTTMSNSMVANASLVQKIYFPRLIIPAASAIAGLVDFAIAFVVLLVVMLFYGLVPGIALILTLPLLLLSTVLCAMGWGLFLASLNIKYRDVRYALPFGISMLMYVTPVIYPVSLLDGHSAIKTAMLWLNPMASIITAGRAVILGRSVLDWPSLGIAILVSTIYFVVGLCYFRRTEHYFADIA